MPSLLTGLWINLLTCFVSFPFSTRRVPSSEDQPASTLPKSHVCSDGVINHRRDILAVSEPLGSAVGSNFSTSDADVDGSYVPSFYSSFSSPSIQIRPLMHLEHRKPTNAALDDLLVAIVCVLYRVVLNGGDVSGGGCHENWSILSGVWAARCEPWWGFQFWSGTRSIFCSFSY